MEDRKKTRGDSLNWREKSQEENKLSEKEDDLLSRKRNPTVNTQFYRSSGKKNASSDDPYDDKNFIMNKIKTLWFTSNNYNQDRSNDSLLLTDEEINELEKIFLKLKDKPHLFDASMTVNLWSIFSNYGVQFKDKEANVEPNRLRDRLSLMLVENLTALLKKTITQFQYFKLNQFSNFIIAIDRLNVWHRANDDFYDMRIRLLTHIQPAEYLNQYKIFDVLSNLMNLGIQWNMLSKLWQSEITEKVFLFLKKEDNKSIISMLWLIGVIGMPWDSIGKDIQNSVLGVLSQAIAVYSQMKKENPTQIIGKWMPWNEAITHLQKINQIILYYQLNISEKSKEQLQSALKDTQKPEQTQIVGFQQSVINILKILAKNRKELQFKVEADPLTFKPVDVYFPEKKLILEIDGSFHYNLKGDLRPTDKFNQAILEKNNFVVIRLSYSEWNTVEDKQVLLLKKITEGIVLANTKPTSILKTTFNQTNP